MNFFSNLFQKIIQRPMLLNNNSHGNLLVQTYPIGWNQLLGSTRGFKVFGKIRKRCKDCYFVTRDERMYNLCKTHQKHKQMSIRHTDKAYYILTSVQQKKKRDW